MLEFKNISKDFGEQKGIYNFNLTIKEGQIIGLVGDNGAGKSTLLKSVFQEYKKDEGEVLLFNESITINNNLTKICFFPDQSVYPKDITISDFALHDGLMCGLNKKEVNERLINLLTEFNLLEYKDKKFESLSSGMQKRALLAICLISKPKYLILDEPTANLDVKTRLEFQKILKTLAVQNKVGVLITSHIIDELEHLIDYLVIIEKGHTKYSSTFDNTKEKIEPIYNANTEQKEEKDFSQLY